MASSSMSLFGLLLVLVILPFPSHASDPDPLQDICVADLDAPISINGFPCKPASEVTSDDFFTDFSKDPTTFDVFKRAVTFGDVSGFPAVNTQGVSLFRIDLGVGGINPPHTHPRATEAGIVLKGRVLVGFVTTNNTFFSKVLTPGMVFLIPRALVHFQLNVGNEPATFIPIFNTQNPGVSDSIGTIFDATPPVPNEVLTKSFRVGDDVINAIRAARAQSS
ncbi:germin-like protein 1-1 [Citrus sinensis]|uniref:germin-like protein 1-1 n=1 Tax=Citrus sinensis TaxID=2711 RepID=UPI002279DF8C|nr:germin-like protein 1-1 [Citrus sinensis]